MAVNLSNNPNYKGQWSRDSATNEEYMQGDIVIYNGIFYEKADDGSAYESPDIESGWSVYGSQATINGVNTVVYGNHVLIDLSEDTVDSSKLLSGATAHDKAGNQITGTVVIQNFYSGTTEPDNSLGSDGDLYFLLES